MVQIEAVSGLGTESDPLEGQLQRSRAKIDKIGKSYFLVEKWEK